MLAAARLGLADVTVGTSASAVAHTASVKNRIANLLMRPS
jgi:hypothetical protein